MLFSPTMRGDRLELHPLLFQSMSNLVSGDEELLLDPLLIPLPQAHVYSRALIYFQEYFLHVPVVTEFQCQMETNSIILIKFQPNMLKLGRFLCVCVCTTFSIKRIY
jgi:hypothetical protein